MDRPYRKKRPKSKEWYEALDRAAKEGTRRLLEAVEKRKREEAQTE